MNKTSGQRFCASSKDRPRISMIVATLNRYDHLEKLLRSIDNQTIEEKIELIVIDQSMPPELKRIEQMCVNFRHSLKYLYSEIMGLSRARNLGLNHCSGEIVLFPDDDCEYPPGFLQKMIEELKERKEYGFIAGVYKESDLGTHVFPRKTRKLNRWILTTEGICSVGLAFRSSVIQGMKFDENLGAGSELKTGEETDFVLRVIAKGVIGYYNPELFVYHEVRHQEATLDNYLVADKARGYIFWKNRNVGLIGVALGVSILRHISLIACGYHQHRLRLTAKIEGLRKAVSEEHSFS